jgi:acyl phosphate:glycerol-3-phosphate acyltransferase
MLRFLAFLVGAYLIGSIPFSFLVARWFGVRDVREVGSGNVGATNVMRAAGRPAGALAFLLDALKGAAAAGLAAGIEPPDSPLPALAAVTAVVGHMYPVWLGFRGGKGVATGAGAFLPLQPAVTALALATFALVLVVTRYVSVASVLAAATLAVLSFAFDAPAATSWAVVVCAALIVVKHRENLRRLGRGTERRMRSRSAAPEGPA